MSIGGTTSNIPQRAVADLYPPTKSRSTGRRSYGVNKLALIFVMIIFTHSLWVPHCGLDLARGVVSIFPHIGEFSVTRISHKL